MTPCAPRSIAEVLELARAGLHRLDPVSARAAQQAGAVLVDIRPELNRELEGHLPSALVLDRNVLEWRLDPQSDARLPVASYDLRAVIVCNEGYASSLAAASLQQLGLHAATDLVGGYRAWRAAGLPTVSAAET